MFYSEVMAKNVASKIRQVLHRENGTESILETCQEMFSINDQAWLNLLSQSVSPNPSSDTNRTTIILK